MNSTYIPQFLFSEIIRKVHNLNDEEKSPFFQYRKQEVMNEVKILDPILQAISSEGGTVVAWFVIENSINPRHTYRITSELQEAIGNILTDKNWEVIVQLIPGNLPLTVTDLLIDVERLVHKLAVKYPFGNFSQIVGYGHPAPFQALFLEGIRQFENRYASVYWEKNEVSIITTTIRQNYKSWVKQFRDFLIDHDYQAALEIITDIPQTKKVRGLKALLQMLVDRFNFSFDLALEHLNEARELLEDHYILEQTKGILEQLLSPVEERRDIARIQELFRQIDVFLEVDDMPSFLVRFYRVREAILYYLIRHSRTGFYESLPENFERRNFFDKIQKLDEQYISWEVDGNYGAYFYIKSANVGHTLEARNKSFLGHSRRSVDSRQIWRSYDGTDKTSAPKAKQRFMMDTKIMMRDLGIIEDGNLLELNKYLLEISSKLEGEVKVLG